MNKVGDPRLDYEFGSFPLYPPPSVYIYGKLHHNRGLKYCGRYNGEDS